MILWRNVKHSLKFITFVALCNISFAAEITISNQDIQEYNARMTMHVDSLEKLAALYPKTVDEINLWVACAIQVASQELAEILSIENPTFENVIKAFDLAEAKFHTFHAIISQFSDVHPDQEIREVCQKVSSNLQNAAIDLYQNPALYQIVQKCYDLYYESDSLSQADKRLLYETLEGCKSSGLHFPQPILDQVTQIAKELATMEHDFMINISIDNRTISCTKDELAGLSEKFIESLKKEGDTYILSCNVPTYIEILTECSNAQTRKTMFFAYQNIAYPANESLLISLLQKRDDLAKLFGHSSFAQQDLLRTSAQNSKTVEKFLIDLAQVATQKANTEFTCLKNNLPDGVVCNDDGTLNPWDYPYALTQYKKQHYAVDETKLAEYFPVQKVIDGVFNIYQDFLGLTFNKVQPLWSWHPDVFLIEIYQTSSQEFLGYLFLDLYPRPFKFTHACHASQISSFNHNGTYNPSVATIIANFPQPTEKNPALLKHNDVVIFFHEFGHAMHHVLSRTHHANHSSNKSAPDFVEIPSQMFELWMWQPEMLAQVSAHYQTQEPLPADLIEKKIALKNMNSGSAILRQCMLALFALHLMTHQDMSYNPSALWKSLHDQYLKSLLAYQTENHWYTNFGHLSAPYFYACKYYCYLWTEVFAIDLFTMIKNNNFSDVYRQKVIDFLSAGASMDGQILVENFLERQPNQEAFLKEFGLQ